MFYLLFPRWWCGICSNSICEFSRRPKHFSQISIRFFIDITCKTISYHRTDIFKEAIYTRCSPDVICMLFYFIFYKLLLFIKINYKIYFIWVCNTVSYFNFVWSLNYQCKNETKINIGKFYRNNMADVWYCARCDNLNKNNAPSIQCSLFWFSRGFTKDVLALQMRVSLKSSH